MTNAPPPAQLVNLQARLKDHERKAKKHRKPFDQINAADLLSRADRDAAGNVLCYNCKCVVDFAPDAVGKPAKATVGHVFPLMADGGCHTVKNVEIECWQCNQTQNNTQDTPFIALGKSMAVNVVTIEEKREAKASRPRSKLRSKSEWSTGRKLPTKADKKRVMENWK